MVNEDKPIDNLVFELKERAKELNCLYIIEDSLNRSEITLRQAFHTVIHAIPPTFQFPNICKAKLVYGEIVYQTDNFEETEWFLKSNIVVQDKIVGAIAIYYTEPVPTTSQVTFLKEEKRLVDTIADRLGHFILHQKLKSVFSESNVIREQSTGKRKGEWRIVLDMIRKTDPNLFMSLLRKMLNLLCWKGVEEAEMLLKHSNVSRRANEEAYLDDNKPIKLAKIINYDQYVDTILRLADENLPDEIILERIQNWIQEDKSSTLIKVVESQDTSLTEIADAIRKHYHLTPEPFELPPETVKNLRVSLLSKK